MKGIWEEIKPEIRWLLVAAGMPCLLFMLGVLLSFIVYPYNIEGASKILMVFGGAGVLISIFLIIHRSRQIIKRLEK